MGISPSECPIELSVRFFNRKWMLAILRDVVCHGRTRFHAFLAANPGLTDKVLSRRLRELVAEGLLERSGDGKLVRYQLTEKGRRAIPIVAAYYDYGVRHQADQLLVDTDRQAGESVLGLDAFEVGSR